jgi:hypothetical protein
MNQFSNNSTVLNFFRSSIFNARMLPGVTFASNKNRGFAKSNIERPISLGKVTSPNLPPLFAKASKSNSEMDNYREEVKKVFDKVERDESLKKGAKGKAESFSLDELGEKLGKDFEVKGEPTRMVSPEVAAFEADLNEEREAENISDDDAEETLDEITLQLQAELEESNVKRKLQASENIRIAEKKLQDLKLASASDPTPAIRNFEFGRRGVEEIEMESTPVDDSTYSSPIVEQLEIIGKNPKAYSIDLLALGISRFNGEDLNVLRSLTQAELIDMLEEILAEEETDRRPLRREDLESLNLKGTVTSSAVLDKGTKQRFYSMCKISDKRNGFPRRTTFSCLMRAGLSVDFAKNADDDSAFTLDTVIDGKRLHFKFTMKLMKKYLAQLGGTFSPRALSRSFADEIHIIADLYDLDTPISIKYSITGTNKYWAFSGAQEHSGCPEAVRSKLVEHFKSQNFDDKKKS